jgi:hypothetical protein
MGAEFSLTEIPILRANALLEFDILNVGGTSLLAHLTAETRPEQTCFAQLLPFPQYNRSGHHPRGIGVVEERDGAISGALSTVQTIISLGSLDNLTNGIHRRSSFSCATDWDLICSFYWQIA